MELDQSAADGACGSDRRDKKRKNRECEPQGGPFGCLRRSVEAVRPRTLPRQVARGANTGELVRASFPVPSGFVITTEAYDGFVTHSIGWARRSPGRSASSRAVALAIRTPFEGTPLDRAATPRLMFGACGTSY